MEQNGVKSSSENNNNDKVSWIIFGGLQLAHRDLRTARDGEERRNTVQLNVVWTLFPPPSREAIIAQAIASYWNREFCSTLLLGDPVGFLSFIREAILIVRKGEAEAVAGLLAIDAMRICNSKTASHFSSVKESPRFPRLPISIYL